VRKKDLSDGLPHIRKNNFDTPFREKNLHERKNFFNIIYQNRHLLSQSYGHGIAYTVVASCSCPRTAVDFPCAV
jgi:hypothetical protein